MLGAISRPAAAGAFVGTAFKPASRTPSRSPSFRIRAAVAEAPPVQSLRKPGNLYEVLRVKNSASAAEIKSAYRNLAKIYHPDVAAAAKHHPEESFDGCDFIEIRKAYSTLSDPSARAVYDLTLSISTRRRTAGIQNDNGVSGFRNRSGFYTTRRWETDQCW